MTIRRLYLGVDRQDYLVNWQVRKDKRNIQLSAIAAGDNAYGYCFGVHLNFDPSLDAEAIQAEVESNGDLRLPYPHRRFARLWLNADYEEARTKSIVTKQRNSNLSTMMGNTYRSALTRDDIESPNTPSPLKRLPEYGMQIHGEYTMYGHFFFFKCLLGNVQKLPFFIDQDSGLRAACLSAFHDEIKARTVDAFYVRINKELTVEERRHRYNDAKIVLEEAKALRPDMKLQEGSSEN